MTASNTAQWGILLARSGEAEQKQRGISYFCVDMSLPGIEVRPIIEMTGGNHFNETSSAVAGSDPSSFASIRKCLADVFGQDVLSLVKDRRGASGMLGTQNFESEHDDVYHWGYNFSRALTIGGGTSEVQRNIIGARLLGTPREPKPA